MNASVVGDSLVVHRDVHLAVAVDLEFEGLVAPVVHNADGKRLPFIARLLSGDGLYLISVKFSGAGQSQSTWHTFVIRHKTRLSMRPEASGRRRGGSPGGG